MPLIREAPQTVLSTVPSTLIDEGGTGGDPNTPRYEQEASQPRRTHQTTAGQHTNPYNLPRSTVTSANLGVVGAAVFFFILSLMVREPRFRMTFGRRGDGSF